MVVDINYLSKVIKRIILFVITVILVYLGFKLAIFYLPFLVAFIISLLLEPEIKFLMKKCKLKRKISSIIILILIMLLLISLLIWVITTIITEGSNLLNNLNEYVDITSNQIQKIINSINVTKFNISHNVLNTLENSARELLSTLVLWIQNLLKSILSFITSIPKIGIYIAITILSLYFICTDKVYMIDQVEHHLPEIWVKKLYRHIKDLAKVLGSYLKAQAILVFISFVITLIGLYIFKFIGLSINYPLLYAISIGFVDALPIFGAGTVMLPWAIFVAFDGNITLSICILSLWIFISIIRQLVEPKIVAAHIGIHPIFTLIAMYTGFKISGIIGLFIGPIILIILKDLFGTMLDKGVIKSIFSREL